jgi:FOG: EAL domain
VRNHISLKEQLAKILKERGFLLFAQPYFLTTNKEISGAEILLRISHNGNIESIANVIEFLETSGLILKVEDYLFEEIKKFVKNVRIPLSINISSKSLASPDILSKTPRTKRIF